MAFKYDDYDDDYSLTQYKGGGGNKKKSPKDKKNPDGKFTSKHVRISQEKREKAESKRPSNENKEKSIKY